MYPLHSANVIYFTLIVEENGLMKKYFFLALAFCLFLLLGNGSVALADLNIDLSGSSFAATGQENFKIYKFQAPGYEGTYWAEFKWDPINYVFRPVNAGSQKVNTGYPRADRLVTPQWVKEQLIDGNNGGKPYVIVNVAWGPRGKYAEGHIPGSIYVNTDEIEYDCFNPRNDWPVDPGDPPCGDRSTTAEQDAAKGLTASDSLPRNYWNIYPDQYLIPAIANMGITKDTTVVVYGPDISGAARLVWTLMYAGVEDVRLLDGGYEAWLRAGYAGSTTPTVRTPVASFGSAVALHPEYLADTNYVRSVVNSEIANALIVDDRDYEEYIGASAPYSYIPTNGRIAGAIWEVPLMMKELYVNPDIVDIYANGGVYMNPDGTLKPLATIEEMWLKAGLRPDKTITFYCGTGWRSSLSWFLAYMMGWDNVKNYDGSWFYWSMGPDAAQNPVVDERPGLPEAQ